MAAYTSRHELPHHGIQTGAQRDDACLEELRPSNVYQRLWHVHVPELETQRFATAQCGTVQEQQQCAQRIRIDNAARACRGGRNRCEKLFELGFGIDVSRVG